jgi:energy-coupling factor transporter transmembrane protein EcfT
MIIGYLTARIRIKPMMRDLTFWGWWLLFLFLFQIFFSTGERFPSLPWLPIGREGVRQGLLVTWRLGLILGYALLFTAVTRPRELVEALTWFLKPFSFIPGRRLALMVSLTLRFFSRFLDQAEEVRLAVRARLGERRRNPLRRAKALALPLLRRSILDVEETTYALMARGYREDLPSLLSPLPFPHLLPLFLLWAVLLVPFWL